MFGWLKRLFGGRRAGAKSRGPAVLDEDGRPLSPEMMDELADALKELDTAQPRAQHYIMAHIQLRGMAFDNPVAFFGMLHSGNSRAFLREFWDAIGAKMPPDERIAPENLYGEFREYRDHHIGLVSFPPPVGTTEAYCTALVVGPITQLRQPFGPLTTSHQFAQAFKRLPAIYYTLENGARRPGEKPRTVLGAWTKDGSHLNYGDGPEPFLEPFYAEICSRIDGKGSAPQAAFSPGDE